MLQLSWFTSLQQILLKHTPKASSSSLKGCWLVVQYSVQAESNSDVSFSRWTCRNSDLKSVSPAVQCHDISLQALVEKTQCIFLSLTGKHAPAIGEGRWGLPASPQPEVRSHHEEAGSAWVQNSSSPSFGWVYREHLRYPDGQTHRQQHPVSGI